MIQVVMLEQHTAFRQALASVIENERNMCVLGHASSLDDLRPVVGNADIALVGLRLADTTGDAAIAELQRMNRDIDVLVLTGSEDRQEYARAVFAGASGILHKTQTIPDIVDAIRRLSRNEPLFTPAEIIELFRLAHEERERNEAEQLLVSQLSEREIEILQAVARGLGDREIAKELHLRHATVRTHMANILQKLGVNSRLQAVLLAYRHDLITLD